MSVETHNGTAGEGERERGREKEGGREQKSVSERESTCTHAICSVANLKPDRCQKKFTSVRERAIGREKRKASKREGNRDRERKRKSTRERESTMWQVQMLRSLDTESRKPQVGARCQYESVHTKPLLQAHRFACALCAATDFFRLPSCIAGTQWCMVPA